MLLRNSDEYLTDVQLDYGLTLQVIPNELDDLQFLKKERGCIYLNICSTPERCTTKALSS